VAAQKNRPLIRETASVRYQQSTGHDIKESSDDDDDDDDGDDAGHQQQQQQHE